MNPEQTAAVDALYDLVLAYVTLSLVFYCIAAFALTVITVKALAARG